MSLDICPACKLSISDSDNSCGCSHEGWQPIEIAIHWPPCVVVRRWKTRDSLPVYGNQYSYEVVAIWPRTSDLNHPRTSEYKKVDDA